MTQREELLVFEANMNEAQRRFFERAPVEIISDGPMPFDRLLAAEDDGIGDAAGKEEEIGEYEIRQRAIGVRAFLRFIKSEGVDMPSIMKQLFTVGRAVHDEYFMSLTMEESAMMYGNTKACHSWRCKILSGQLELAGAKGIQLPGQKSPESSKSYSAAQQGNQNRRKKKKPAATQMPLRFKDGGAKRPQRSFIRKLQLNKAGNAGFKTGANHEE